MNERPSPYEVLGVSADADIEDVHRAYLALARRHHPDAGGDAAEMRRINEAWALLSDRRRRRRFDQSARHAEPPPRREPDFDLDLDDDLEDDIVERTITVPVTRRQRMVDTLTLLAVMVCMASAAVSFLFGMMLESGPLMGFCVFSLFLTAIFVVARTLLAMRFDASVR